MNYLYEAPWWLPTGIAIAGLATFIAGNNRLNKRTKNIGATVIAFGIALAVTSFLLDSDREVVVKRTRALVQSVEERNWTTFHSLIASSLVINLPDGSSSDELSFQTTPDFLSDSLKNFAESADLQSLRISSLNTPLVEKERIQSTFQVFADSKQYKGLSGWMLEWELDPKTNQWMLIEVEPRDAPGFPAHLAAREVRARVKRLPQTLRDLTR